MRWSNGAQKARLGEHSTDLRGGFEACRRALANRAENSVRGCQVGGATAGRQRCTGCAQGGWGAALDGWLSCPRLRAPVRLPPAQTKRTDQPAL